jgi:cytochrome c-type biogenesis protein
MASGQISIGLMFLAGVVSFLSPCTLPLLPGYLGYMTARAAGPKPSEHPRVHIFLHGLAYVFGFTLLFITLGAAASSLSIFLSPYRTWITRLGGALIILFGLSMTGLIRIPFLQRDLHLQWEPNPKWGFVYSFLLGIIFAAGWTVCTGPMLGIALTLAAFAGTMAQGILLLAVFSLGLGIPFLLLAIALDRVSGWVSRMGRAARIVQMGAGLLFAAVGFLLLFGRLNLLSFLFPEIYFGL